MIYAYKLAIYIQTFDVIHLFSPLIFSNDTQVLVICINQFEIVVNEPLCSQI